MVMCATCCGCITGQGGVSDKAALEYPRAAAIIVVLTDLTYLLACCQCNAGQGVVSDEAGGAQGHR